MGFTGLKTYPNNITPSQAAGRDWKKIRQKWGDEKETERLRGWVRLRHENRYRMWRDGKRERRPRSLKFCVCVWVHVRAYASARRTSVSLRMWLDWLFLRLGVSLCVTVCVSSCCQRICVNLFVCLCVCRHACARMYGGVVGMRGGGGQQAGEEETWYK